MPIVINSVGGRYTHANTHTHTDVRGQKQFLRNQTHASLWLALAWFKNPESLGFNPGATHSLGNSPSKFTLYGNLKTDLLTCMYIDYYNSKPVIVLTVMLPMKWGSSHHDQSSYCTRPSSSSTSQRYPSLKDAILDHPPNMT